MPRNSEEVNIFISPLQGDRGHSAQVYSDVPITDKSVETQSFLEASYGLVQPFEEPRLLGMHNPVFGYVRFWIRAGRYQG
ncbi:uncharacterized protein LACBIDRAFT_310680 [Laccaria bicolor S238N-H82]|uniref:Predicted protein n=1 Tax=Laccaria bicolor (strain S238N-H82 / ATCC MYA-4686) TaxID=486041 RepID=B0DUW2_LACBS|nr:uncharacterized protein LACBIDRAFT_310680 [Laccaria bicolor S238N-H82]EDR01613.1 predicted protein [Laccaria bicolor S238N-H82]|eukprot:XP_001887689.1 predicted protein [Laccaria bicolor S238N-H82]